MVRDGEKRTKNLDHKGEKSQITNDFNNSKFMKKIKMADLTKNIISVTVRDRVKNAKIWDHKGKRSQIIKIIKNAKFKDVRLDQKCYLGNGRR